MVNSIIAFDNEDASLGNFFSICKDIVTSAINNVGGDKWNNFEMPTRTFNEVNLELTTARFKGEQFVFSSFTHGNKEALFSKGAQIVYSPCEPNHLANSLSFCFSCSSGKILGLDLIRKGTLCFIGYNKDVFIWSTYLQIFAECATEAIVSFYNGKTVKKSLEAKVEKYNNSIDNIYLKNYPVAALLMDNRDAITLYGDDTLTISSFIKN